MNVNKIVKTRYNLLINSKMEFQDIFNIMFMDLNNILAEYIGKNGIIKETYGQAREKILNIAYSINKKYPNIKNEYIGISIDSSYEWLLIFWAILMSNNKPYLINIKYPKSLTNNILDTLNVNYLIGDDLGYDKELINLFDLNLVRDNDNFICENEIALSTSATSAKEKIIFYTGKEISYQVLNAKGILKQNKLIKKHYKNELKQLVFLPLYHVFGFIATYLWFSFFGRTFVFLQNYSSDTILYTIKRFNVTHIFAVPLFWSSIEKEIYKELKQRSEHDQNKFNKGIEKTYKIQKLMPYKGISISKKLLKQITEKLFGKTVFFTITGGGYIKDSTLKLINSLGYPLYNGYGMTEVGITSVELSKKISDRIKNSIGRPFDSVEYKIENNELYIKGKSISHKMIVNNEIITIKEDEYFKTSDIVYKDKDGRFYIKGRLDDLFIGENGENINPDEVEKNLNLDLINRFSVTNINNELSLIVEIDEFMPKSKIENINNQIISELNKLSNSYRVSKYYYTYDKIANPNAIKVSRTYLLNEYNKGNIKLLSYNDLKQKIDDDKSNNNIVNIIIELTKEILQTDIEINKDSNFFFELGLNSIDYFTLIFAINKKFNIELQIKDESLSTPILLALSVEELLK